MNTRLIILILSIIVIGTGAVLYFFSRGGQSSQLTQEVPTGGGLPVAGQNTNPISGTGIAVPTQQLAVSTLDGGVVVTNNFLKDPGIVADPVNSGYYDLGYSATNTPPFMITYISSTQYFNIELLQEPIGQVRELAQRYLEQLLGISENDLCRINYTVSAPSSISSIYGGASLGFSFCPGAAILPK